MFQADRIAKKRGENPEDKMPDVREALEQARRNRDGMPQDSAVPAAQEE